MAIRTVMSLVCNSPPGCSAIPHTFATVMFFTSPKWKTDFEDIAGRLETQKTELKSDLQIYIGLTVTNMNTRVIHIEKLMEAVFEEMLSPKEKEFAKFVKPNGTETSQQMEELFRKLESATSDMSMTCAEFMKEWGKNVNVAAVLSENKNAFEQKFKLLREDAEATTKREGDRVIMEVVTTLHAGAHDCVTNKVFRITRS